MAINDTVAAFLSQYFTVFILGKRRSDHSLGDGEIDHLSQRGMSVKLPSSFLIIFPLRMFLPD